MNNENKFARARSWTAVFRVVFWASPVLLAACQLTPSIDPTEAAGAIATKLASGELEDANRLFDDVKRSSEHKEVVFAVVYKQSQGRYGQQDYATAERFLRFLVVHYPKAAAPREALLYTLFLGRRAGETTAPSEEVLKEMESLLKKLDASDRKLPVWRHLVAAQVAVDRGRTSDARDSLATFRASWDGSPPALRSYVDEIDRYLATHKEVEG